MKSRVFDKSNFIRHIKKLKAFHMRLIQSKKGKGGSLLSKRRSLRDTSSRVAEAIEESIKFLKQNKAGMKRVLYKRFFETTDKIARKFLQTKEFKRCHRQYPMVKAIVERYMITDQGGKVDAISKLKAIRWYRQSQIKTIAKTIKSQLMGEANKKGVDLDAHFQRIFSTSAPDTPIQPLECSSSFLTFENE